MKYLSQNSFDKTVPNCHVEHFIKVNGTQGSRKSSTKLGLSPEKIPRKKNLISSCKQGNVVFQKAAEQASPLRLVKKKSDWRP